MATLDEQIKEIEEEIQKTPYNKATQHHIGKLKAKVARLKSELEVRRLRSGGGGVSYAVKKSGNATIGLVGFPSVGKSTLINKITDATSAVAAYDFTTVTIIPGMLEWRGARMQILDMPGLIRGASRGRGRGREVLSVARACDLILLMIDVFETHLDVLVDELRQGGLRLNEKPADVVLSKANRGGLTVSPTVKLTKIDEETIADICREWGYLNGTVVVREDITEDQLIDVLAGNRVYAPALIVVNKIDLVGQAWLDELRRKLPDWKFLPISAMKDVGLTKLKDSLYDELRFMRVYLKPQGKEADMVEPLIIKGGASVGDVCDAIHREWKRRFRFATIRGPSAQFPGQKIGLDHRLRDSDVLTIVLKKA
jgi:small GTP-binding protein